MKIINFGERCDDPVTLCLGRYESLHRGHRAIIDTARDKAQKSGSRVMLMTYDEGVCDRFGRLVLTFSERCEMARSLGVDLVLRVDFSEKFRNMSADEFLKELDSTLDIKGALCGYDFRFGKNRGGDIFTLKDFCDEIGAGFFPHEEVDYLGEKISTTRVKTAIKEGDLVKASVMLGYDFFIVGTVEKGRGQGREMGFPTANLTFPAEKCILPPAVYKSEIEIKGKRYKGLTNFGAAPTFGCDKTLVETHIKGFSENVYGERLKVSFCSFLREIRHFSSAEELKEQLKKDLREI